MNKAYELHIHEALYDVYHKGFGRIEWIRFYRWFGRARLTDSIWDEVEEIWQEILEREGDEGWRLGALNWANPTYLTLVCLDPENTKPDEASLIPISEWKSKKPSRKDKKSTRKGNI